MNSDDLWHYERAGNRYRQALNQLNMSKHIKRSLTGHDRNVRLQYNVCFYPAVLTVHFLRAIFNSIGLIVYAVRVLPGMLNKLRYCGHIAFLSAPHYVHSLRHMCFLPLLIKMMYKSTYVHTYVYTANCKPQNK